MSKTKNIGKLPLPKKYEYMVYTCHCMDFTEESLDIQREGWVILENTFLIMDYNVKFIARRMVRL